MTPHYSDDSVTVWHGDCLDVLRSLPDNSVDSVVCDPPYGLANTTPEQVADTLIRWINGERDYLPTGQGFMGKAWDAFVPPVAVWDDCLRVLKPGGHLLAFAGSRTHDLMTLAIRMAGFDIRDSIAWLYGSGFPKSLDVSKAIDKAKPAHVAEDVETVRAFLHAEWKRAGVRSKTVDAAFGFRGNMAAPHWFYKTSQNSAPTAEQWPILLDLLGVEDVPEDVRAACERVLAQKGLPGPAWFSREVTGTKRTGDPVAWYAEKQRGTGVVDITAPAAPAAQQWQGWGTALKPAFEPVVVARKPLVGTVAANVLAHGTGALNVDGCRVPGSSENARESKGTGLGYHGADGERGAWTGAAGRWPTNVVLSSDAAEELDRQSGNRPGAVSNGSKTAEGMAGTDTFRIHAREQKPGYADQGGASRFFPVFRYQAKAPTRERVSYVKEGAGTGRVTGLGGKVRQCNVCETRAIESGAKEPSCGHGDFRWEEPTTDTGSKVAHPTVKPLALMQWLVRLVTPPGGVVLEPFAGSGTTVEACLIEGFRCIAIEREADYLPLIEARIARQRKPDVPNAAEALALFDFEEPA